MNELTLKEKQEIMLDIMLDIDRFCRENGIRYSLAYGTMLGAVRHGGFIPWDDDLDIFMLRDDFEKFVESYPAHRYHVLYNTRNDKEFLATGYAKVHDPKTAIVGEKTHTKYGVFVDIFPLDPVPEDPEEQRKYIKRHKSLHNRLHHRQQKDINSILKTYRHSLDWWWEKCHYEIRQHKYDGSPYVAGLLGPVIPAVYEKDAFDTLKDIEFEGHKLMVFADTHTPLAKVFGDDYMTPKKWIHNYTIRRNGDDQKN